MSTDPISLVGWASAIVFTVLVFSRANKLLVRIYEYRLRQVLTRRGMSIESMNSRAGFFDTMDVIDFDVIFITPRCRRIQGVFRVGDRWFRLTFGTVRFHGRSDRPEHLKKQPKIKKPPKTLFD